MTRHHNNLSRHAESFTHSRKKTIGTHSTHHQKVSNVLKHETSLIYSVLFDSVVPNMYFVYNNSALMSKGSFVIMLYCDSFGFQRESKESRMCCLHAGRKEAKI